MHFYWTILNLLSSIAVIVESPTITQALACHVCLISSGEGSLIVKFSSETLLLDVFLKRSTVNALVACSHVSVL